MSASWRACLGSGRAGRAGRAGCMYFWVRVRTLWLASMALIFRASLPNDWRWQFQTSRLGNAGPLISGNGMVLRTSWTYSVMHRLLQRQPNVIVNRTKPVHSIDWRWPRPKSVHVHEGVSGLPWPVPHASCLTESRPPKAYLHPPNVHCATGSAAHFNRIFAPKVSPFSIASMPTFPATLLVLLLALVHCVTSNTTYSTCYTKRATTSKASVGSTTYALTLTKTASQTIVSKSEPCIPKFRCLTDPLRF